MAFWIKNCQRLLDTNFFVNVLYIIGLQYGIIINYG